MPALDKKVFEVIQSNSTKKKQSKEIAHALACAVGGFSEYSSPLEHIGELPKLGFKKQHAPLFNST